MEAVTLTMIYHPGPFIAAGGGRPCQSKVAAALVQAADGAQTRKNC